MKVYTKTGDSGTTSLVGGKRVPKNHPRVEAYGDMDELISFIGIVISDTSTQHEKDTLRRIQEQLMLISAHFASDDSYKKLEDVSNDEVTLLEAEIDKMSAILPEQKAFILPGTPRVSSECHVARTICRRAERHAIAIVNSSSNEKDFTESVHIGLKYLNRLSDYLFVLARFYCMETEEPETFWIP